MTSFGRLLCGYWRQRRDSLRGSVLTQERLGELLGHEVGDGGNSGAAVSDWEWRESKIAADNGSVLVSLITVPHNQGGLTKLAQADCRRRARSCNASLNRPRCLHNMCLSAGKSNLEETVGTELQSRAAGT